MQIKNSKMNKNVQKYTKKLSRNSGKISMNMKNSAMTGNTCTILQSTYFAFQPSTSVHCPRRYLRDE